MKKRLIASDYDGTLYRGGAVSGEDRDAVLRWQRTGGLFGMVTGRGMRTPEYMAAADIRCDFYLINNGATLLDAEGRVLREKRMSKETFVALERAFRQLGGADEYGVYSDGCSLAQYSARMPTAYSARERADALNGLFPGQINAVANGLNINIMAFGEGKAEGIGHALRYFGLPMDAAVAVGDDFNDYDMIVRWDGWAMADGRVRAVLATSRICESVADLIGQLMGSDSE